MSFLYPAFLIGALAIAVPVLLHLLRDEEAPELRFSAVRLLRDVKVERTRRRRIRDWLLLALRAAALLLLAFAFARPYLPGRQVAGHATSVILLDRSASMGRDGSWQRAREAAAAEIDRVRPGHAVALIAFDDRPAVVVEPTFDRGAATAALGRIERGIGGTHYRPALARAVSLLDEMDAPSGRIVLISDLQGTPADARATVPESISIEVRAISGSADNVAVLGTRRLGDGVMATLRNDGRSAAGVRVQLSDARDGRLLAEAPVELTPLQPVDVTLRATTLPSSMRVSLAEPDRGGMTADDSRYLVTDATPRTRILVVSAREDRFYLEAALTAADDTAAFDVSTASVQSLMAALARDPQPEIVFLVGPRGLDRAGRDTLLRYVRGGGRLFVGTSDAVNEPGFAPLVEGLTISMPHADDPVLRLAAVEARHPVFSRLGPLGDAIGAARFTRAWRVQALGWDVLVSFDDGAPALVERAAGNGRVLFFASDLNRDWNDLPLQPAFVPLVHEIVRYLSPERGRGEYTPATLPDGTTPALGLVTLAGGRRVVVNPDPRESDSGRMDSVQFSSAVRHHGARRLDAAATRRREQAVEQQQSLWRYGLLVMFGTLVAEGLLGGRHRLGESGWRRRRVEGGTSI